ncbi:GNAT family N-acetyltransferase [Cellulomonas humilata]|uniref:GNAT family N-acyltransferase n=1 Tax=Cellulomonas humilata TaxID=144055 RepID=A0ABU0EHY3_9CELL|nr:GNAT family N-acetyltransferase [Cellulomonas humilata]MDQ0374437.1 putative GNAT family N-acyltransferase [Cellulomonas humilata]
MSVRVVRVETPEQRAAMTSIRMAVFVHEQNVVAENEMDALDDDPATLHVLAVGDDGSALGTARLLPPHHAGEPAHIGRVAVDGAARGLGVGALLMAALEDEALERFGDVTDGVRSVSVELSAQEQALGFYARLGYVARPERYLDEAIWHRDAVKVVTAPA